MSPPHTLFGRRLREARTRAGIAQDRLGVMILFSSVSHWSQRMLAEKAEVVMVDGGGEREGFWR